MKLSEGRRWKGSPELWAIAVALLFLVPAAGTAQAALWPAGMEDVHPFEGFGGLAWGVDRAAVVQTWGEPDRTDDLEGSAATAVVYANAVLAGEDASLGFLVHPEEGLIRGQALLPYGEGEDCSRLYAKIRDLVDAALPAQEVTSRVERGPNDLTFCTAFQIGAASARAAWTDPDSDARVTLMLDLPTGTVRLSYESPAFAELIGDTAAGPR